MAKELTQGPRDAQAAYADGSGQLVVIDGRGTVWKWDGNVTSDANGDPIVGPPGVDKVFISRGGNNLIVIDPSGVVWTYSLVHQVWTENMNTTDVLEGEAEKEHEPWKQGNNVSLPKPPEPETEAAEHEGKRSRKKAAA